MLLKCTVQFVLKKGKRSITHLTTSNIVILLESTLRTIDSPSTLLRGTFGRGTKGSDLQLSSIPSRRPTPSLLLLLLLPFRPSSPIPNLIPIHVSNPTPTHGGTSYSCATSSIEIELLLRFPAKETSPTKALASSLFTSFRAPGSNVGVDQVGQINIFVDLGLEKLEDSCFVKT